MTPRTLLLMMLATLLASAAWLLWPGARPAPKAAAVLLPELAAGPLPITRIVERGAGNAVLATLTLQDGLWRVQERAGWPANAVVVAQVLDALTAVRTAEEKTRLPERHARLGLESVEKPDAQGVELCLERKAAPLCLVVGDANPVTGHQYVRRSEQAQAWLADRALDVPRTVEHWLDRRVIDRPMARIERVEITPASGKSFQLNRVQDRFSLDGLPSVAMADPDRGNGTASLLDALVVDDVAPEQHEKTKQTATFVGVDGLDVTIQAWPAMQGTWMRCHPSLDEARASAWDSARLADLRAELTFIAQRCRDHVFRLPESKADNLMRSREQYLAD